MSDNETLKNVIRSQKDKIKELQNELRETRRQITRLEKLLSDPVQVEVFEHHTFAVPEDVEDVRFGE